MSAAAAAAEREPWYADIPTQTGPPVLAVIPPRPALNARATGSADKNERARTTTTTTLSVRIAALPPLPAAGSLNNTEEADELLNWETTLQGDAPTSVVEWTKVMDDMILYPERNSSNILRGQVLADEKAEAEADASVEANGGDGAEGWKVKRRVLRRLIPRRPAMSGQMLQLCCCFERSTADEGLVVYTTLIETGQTALLLERPIASIEEVVRSSERPIKTDQIPFYHPPLLALAFSYTSTLSGPPRIAISVLPIPHTGGVTDYHHRISSSLLTSIHKLAWGNRNSYVPRVPQDRLVPKRLYQDVYINLKTRWAAWLQQQWREKTPGEKHIHEDLAIAAWCMCFWRSRFGTMPDEDGGVSLDERPWRSDQKTWARPAGGFVDAGCGNGLLVWLLNNEGYLGHGFDLRARKSWDLFRSEGVVEVAKNAHQPSAQRVITKPADLRVASLDALHFIHTCSQSGTCTGHSNLFPDDCFLIGNHADELTPVLPLLGAVLPGGCAGVLNIPCCPWTVEGERFTKVKYPISREEIANLLGFDLDDADVVAPEKQRLLRRLVDEISLGPGVDPPTASRPSSTPSMTRNVAYLAYVSHLHLLCGWEVEKEALRIPSTRNWAVASTRRVGGCEDRVRARVSEMVRPALEKWKARDAP